MASDAPEPVESVAVDEARNTVVWVGGGQLNTELSGHSTLLSSVFTETTNVAVTSRPMDGRYYFSGTAAGSGRIVAYQFGSMTTHEVPTPKVLSIAVAINSIGSDTLYFIDDDNHVYSCGVTPQYECIQSAVSCAGANCIAGQGYKVAAAGDAFAFFAPFMLTVVYQGQLLPPLAMTSGAFLAMDATRVVWGQKDGSIWTATYGSTKVGPSQRIATSTEPIVDLAFKGTNLVFSTSGGRVFLVDFHALQ
jgi:hypothetical protein